VKTERGYGKEGTKETTAKWVWASFDTVPVPIMPSKIFSCCQEQTFAKSNLRERKHKSGTILTRVYGIHTRKTLQSKKEAFMQCCGSESASASNKNPDPDPHPDQHQSDKIHPEPDPDPHQFADDKPKWYGI
jgi:hypothetical protein